MTERKVVKVKFVLDKSGSMISCKDQMISGFMEQIQEMIGEEDTLGVIYLVTLILFDTKSHVIYTDRPVKEVEYLTKETYLPHGGTALHDAIGDAVEVAEEGVGCVVNVMTDGEENSSRRYDAHLVKAMVEHREQHNKWAFTYIGANQDAVLSAAVLGVNNSLNYTIDNTEAAVGAMRSARCSYTTSYCAGNVKTANLFSDVDKSELVK